MLGDVDVPGHGHIAVDRFPESKRQRERLPRCDFAGDVHQLVLGHIVETRVLLPHDLAVHQRLSEAMSHAHVSVDPGLALLLGPGIVVVHDVKDQRERRLRIGGKQYPRSHLAEVGRL